MDPLRTQIAQMSLQKPDGFNPYAAGDKAYGMGGRRNATSGPVSAEGQKGYQQRDMQLAAMKQALMQRMMAGQYGGQQQ